MGVRAPNGARPILVARSPMLADGEARRCFLFGTWRSAVAELFGNSRSQQLAAGQPSDVLARCWILASAERDRSLNLLGKGAALHLCAPFPRAREGGASASGFDPAAPARSYGDCSARADRNRWPRGGCGVCALWHFRLGDRALIRGRAGAERRAANPGRPVADAGRRRGPPLFSVWDLAIGGGGALRQQPLATAGRRAAFGCARTLLDFGIGRARPLLESARKGGRVTPLRAFPRAREGGASASGFDPAAPARSYGDCSARADRNRWPRGGCGVCALWHFRLGDRALIRGRAGAERRAANEGKTRRLLSNRPGPNFDAESNSKRTATRQQLDLQRLLCNQTVEL